MIYLSKVANFALPHLHLSPRMGVTPFEFRRDLWHLKISVLGLSCCVVHVILHLPFWYNTGVWQTHRQTDTHWHCCASVDTSCSFIAFTFAFLLKYICVFVAVFCAFITRPELRLSFFFQVTRPLTWQLPAYGSCRSIDIAQGGWDVLRSLSTLFHCQFTAKFATERI